MKKIADFYNDFGFILGFVFLTILLQALIGDEFAEKFLLVVLMSMIILNAKSFVGFMKKTFSN